MFSLRNKKKISLNYPQYPLLPGALISSVTGLLHNRIVTPNIQEYLSLRIDKHFRVTENVSLQTWRENV